MSYINENNNPKDPFVNICTLVFSKWEFLKWGQEHGVQHLSKLMYI